MTPDDNGATPEELRALFETPDTSDADAQMPTGTKSAKPVVTEITTAMQRKLDEQPKADTSRQVSDFLRFALELGHSDGEIQWLAPQSKAYQAWQAKKPNRKAADDIARMLAKFRPKHVHAGQRCDAAGCPNKPNWQTGEPKTTDRTWASYELTRTQLANLPPPEPILDGILMRDSVVVVWGKPGAMKSFVVLDWAMTIASQLSDWQGRACRTGPVYYVVGEGVHGTNKRAEAWELARAGDVGDSIRFRSRAVDLRDVLDLDEMVERMEEFKPSLIVVDTLARSMVGGDENASRDVGQVVAAADRVREAAGGACVLFVHHTTKDNAGYRGSSALEGAADTMIECSRSDSIVTLRCHKQKDGPEFEPLLLRVVPTRESLVLNLTEGREVDVSISNSSALSIFAEHFGQTKGSKSEIKTIFEDIGKWSRATSYRKINDLVKAGLIKDVGKGNVALYQLTEAGRETTALMAGRLL